MTYLISQMQGLYLKDISLHNHLSENASIGEVLDVLASGISSLTNPKKIVDTFASVKQKKISDFTVDKYIGHMEDAFMLSRVKRYDIKGRKYIGTPYKIYFEDIGLRYRGYRVDIGTVETREKNAEGKELRSQREIDFIATLGSKKYYIQSAYAIPDQTKYEQETIPFDKTMDSFKKLIVVEKSMKPRRDEKGYVMMGIKEFLLNRDSLDA